MEENNSGIGGLIVLVVIAYFLGWFGDGKKDQVETPEIQDVGLADFETGGSSNLPLINTHKSDYYDDSQYEDYVEKPNGTYTVEACSQNTGSCYDLDADIYDGVVDRIYFPNGGHLDLDGAELDEYYSASGESYTDSDGYDGDSWDINCYDCE